MQANRQNTLSQERFEQEWKEAHCRIFRFCETAPGKRWLPEQVFQEGVTFSFICPYFYFRKKVFGALKQILLALREDALIIGSAGSSVGEEKEKLVYPTRVEYEEYLQGGR